MIIVKDPEYITKQFKSAVVTIGNFDGVHLGHQTLLLKTVQKARELNGTSLSITFKPHPAQITNLKMAPKSISSYQQKNELISKLGIDVLLYIPFTEKFASISAVDFVEKFLFEQIGMKVIVIGKDYNFGKDRLGNTETLKKYARKLDFQVIIEKLIQAPGVFNNRISSTAIRNMITEGDVVSATKLLGRNYCMRGKIMHGKGRGGKLLGFPTANIDPDNDLYPKTGVYAVTINRKNQTFDGVANIGYNPTFQNNLLTLEIHILNFEKKIYGERIEVNFIKRLRSEMKFSSTLELITQIHKDIDRANKILTPVVKKNLENPNQ